MLPEVVSLAETEDILSRDADFFVPNFKGFLVIFIDRRIQTILFQANHLGQELPTPGNGLVLKVITKGEIAQHLKIGAVAGGLADILNIAGTDTLLAGAHSSSGGLHFAFKVGLHRCHTGVDQQQGRIILGNQ